MSNKARVVIEACALRVVRVGLNHFEVEAQHFDLLGEPHWRPTKYRMPVRKDTDDQPIPQWLVMTSLERLSKRRRRRRSKR